MHTSDPHGQVPRCMDWLSTGGDWTFVKGVVEQSTIFLIEIMVKSLGDGRECRRKVVPKQVLWLF